MDNKKIKIDVIDKRFKQQIDIHVKKPEIALEKECLNFFKGDKGDKGDTGETGQTGADGKSAYETAQEGGYTGTEQQFATALNDIAGIGIKEYSFDTTDWEEYLTGQYRLTITQLQHGLANAFVNYMEIYNSADTCWENNLSAVQKRLANDSIVIYSDKPVKCNLTIKGER